MDVAVVHCCDPWDLWEEWDFQGDLALGVIDQRSDDLENTEIIRKRGGNPLDVLEQQGRWMREKEAEGVPANAAKVQTTVTLQAD